MFSKLLFILFVSSQFTQSSFAQSCPANTHCWSFQGKGTAMAQAGDGIVIAVDQSIYHISKVSQKQLIARFTDAPFIQSVAVSKNLKKIIISFSQKPGFPLKTLPIRIGTCFSPHFKNCHWEKSGPEFYDELSPPHEDHYLSLHNLIIHNATLYGTTSGDTVAYSRDWGKSWKSLFKGESLNNEQLCYPGYIAFSGDGMKLYQGMECPLDFAHVRSYPTNQLPIKRASGSFIMDIDNISNRMINSITPHPFNENQIFIGHEGALTVVDTKTDKWRFLYKSDNSILPYVYIRGIFVDPKEQSKMMIAGPLQEPLSKKSFNLLETRDGGKTWSRKRNPFDLFLKIQQAIQVKEHFFILANGQNPLNQRITYILAYD